MAEVTEFKQEEEVSIKKEPQPTLTPPASEEMDKMGDSSSDLSDLDMDQDDIGEIEPAYYYEGGKVPVFTPTMKQFESFKKFIDKIDRYGMKSGIVKVIPPKEWRDSLPQLDEAVKTVKVKNPISQEFHGSHGTYTQANMEKQRSYNLPQWKSLCEESNHQPPAKRGERRRNQEKVTRGGAGTQTTKKVVTPQTEGVKRGRGRPRTKPVPTEKPREDSEEAETSNIQVPPSPTSPAPRAKRVKKEKATSDTEEEGTPAKTRGRQPKSVTSRRKNNRGEQADVVDEEAFKGFDYRTHNQEEWTPERCHELETSYWKSLTFNNPMYGADMPGSLFEDTTTSWNVAHLENLLDVLGQKVPGVNTAYLYLGMWKATFAWHLEDVDLYSINYIHFGAPKQWYSISQADARRFETAMRSVWPQDAKNCDQFLRHKTYLISPQNLKSQFNIEVNRLVHYEGEFVITFPYGYHSGYNLGYNCAESVNFATEAWLDYGKIAKKCDCESDSVWVDVWDIERRLRGEPTPEYYEETDDDDEEDLEDPTDLPTPPESVNGKAKPRASKRKRETTKDSKSKTKKIKIKLRAPAAAEPCILCPNDPSFEDLLVTDTGKKAHRCCAEYTPETWISKGKDLEIVRGIDQIAKARLELKCNYCRNKRGAVFQCSFKKCARAYHATCAFAAGVQVDQGLISVYDEDGTEYAQEAFDFRCRFHRARRPKYPDQQACTQALEDNALIRRATSRLKRGDIIQYQYYLGDIFAGFVLENRLSEKSILVESIPQGALIEVDHKWVLCLDKGQSHLVPPSETAKPLPAHLHHNKSCSTEHPTNEVPKPDDPFFHPECPQVWSEFHVGKPCNPIPLNVDFARPKSLWHYLGKTSTEAKAQYTANLAVQLNDPAANFLDSVKPVPTPAQPPPPRQSYPASYPTTLTKPSSFSGLQGLNKQQPNFYSDLLKSIQKEKTGPGKPDIARTILSASTANPRTLNRPATTKSSPKSSLPVIYQGPTPSKPNPKAPQAPIASMGSGMIPVSKVMEAAKNPQQSLEEIRRLQAALQQKVVGQPQSPPQAQVQQAAPVANMMSTTSPTTQSPFSRPSTSHLTPPSSAHSSIGPRSRSDSMKAIAKYPYLQEAASQRPAVYQSPYAAGGGITDAWLPNPQAPKILRPRTSSLTQDFLTKQTPSQREVVKGHVRTISTEKAMLQQQEAERRQRELQQRFRNSKMGPPISPSLLQTSAFADNFSFRSFSNSPAIPEFGPAYPNPNTYGPIPGHETSQFASFNNQAHGLQFSSPQDFQLQMQREAENQASKPPLMTHEKHSYRAFVRDLQSGVGMMPHGLPPQEMTMDNSMGDGTSGSPLRRGMRAAGTEMLPMMQDPTF